MSCKTIKAGWKHKSGKIVNKEGTWCESLEEAEEAAMEVVNPSKCFVYEDGPDKAIEGFCDKPYPYRKIPGYGCAHYVAHKLGIKTGAKGAKCRKGFSVKITQITYDRERHGLDEAQVNDIWTDRTDDDDSHSGVVVKINNNQVMVRSCNIYGVVSTHFETSGSVWKIK